MDQKELEVGSQTSLSRVHQDCPLSRCRQKKARTPRRKGVAASTTLLGLLALESGLVPRLGRFEGVHEVKNSPTANV